MEKYFTKYRKLIIGDDLHYETPYGIKKMLYADWIASGRLYKPIEKKISEKFGPYVGNTHTETCEVGTMMTKAYEMAHKIVKRHVNAGKDDILINAGFGMTAVVNKLQRIMGLRTCGHLSKKECLQSCEKPVVFISHMEHHSNHTSWYESVADVVIVNPSKDLTIDLDEFRKAMKKYSERRFKIVSITACSNVTGIVTPYHEIAEIAHENQGVCFVDFAASAPYVNINMHPENPKQKLDAIFFSPHKFLGGPGSSGVLIFDSSLYTNKSPDDPGGGTVDWTNAWGEYKFVDDIEKREDGGTPGFLQAIRTALAIELKEKIGVENIVKREKELVKLAFTELEKVPKLHFLADNVRERLGIISFLLENIHFNLIVKLLSDRFGIQLRGGCACAGTYGHFLLDVSPRRSKEITDKITLGDLSDKPGWVRLSLHPTMADEEVIFIADALKQIVNNHDEWSKDYNYQSQNNEYFHKSFEDNKDEKLKKWFSF